MHSRTALISGAGIAGPTLAYWLKAAGFQPTLVERAPALRTGGYVIDFWGLGYDIAEKMGLIDEINRIGYHIREMRIVDDRGRRVAGFGTAVFEELAGGRFVTIARSDLSRVLYDRIKNESEVIFGDEIVALCHKPDGVEVSFAKGGSRRFDLVIGADGLHSNVRKLVFGPQAQFETELGYRVAAFQSQGYRPRDEDVYVLHNEPGWMLGRVTLRNESLPVSFRLRCRGRYRSGIRSSRAEAPLACALRRWRVGVSADPNCIGPHRKSLFRSRQPNQNAQLVARARGAYRRCGILRLIACGTGGSTRHDGSVYYRWGACA